MGDWAPGEGWREVTFDQLQELDRGDEQVTYFGGGRWHYWVREEPVEK